MFVYLPMVTIPVLFLALFCVWITTTYGINRMEDTCYWERANVLKVCRAVLILMIFGFGIWISQDAYGWVPGAVIMLTLCIMVLAFCLLVVSGWEEGFKYHFSNWSKANVVIWFMAFVIVTTHIVVSSAALFHIDAFFDELVPHSMQLEYNLAYSQWLDEQFEEVRIIDGE